MSEEHELEVIYSCRDDEEAQIIIGFLGSHGIEAGIDSDFPHVTFPVEDDSRIYVNSENAEQARQLLAARDVEGVDPLVDEDTIVEDGENPEDEIEA